MELNKYQELSKRTLPAHENHIEKKHALGNYALGVCGEAGEVGDYIKKHVYHLHELNVDEVKKELGDVLHYVAGLATFCGLTLEEVAIGNIQKLAERYPNGFNPEDSKKRVDVE